MVCKNTSTKKRQGGFSFVEFMVSMGIGSMVLLIVAGLMFYTGRSVAAIANYVELDAASRNALDRMSKQIRQTHGLIEATESKLVFQDSDGTKLAFIYDPISRELRSYRNDVADRKPLLTECDSLKFLIFQRNPVEGSYNQYPAAQAASAKLVQLRWTCSRSLLDKWNTESVQSAKIVIRKQ